MLPISLKVIFFLLGIVAILIALWSGSYHIFYYNLIMATSGSVMVILSLSIKLSRLLFSLCVIGILLQINLIFLNYPNAEKFNDYAPIHLNLINLFVYAIGIRLVWSKSKKQKGK